MSVSRTLFMFRSQALAGLCAFSYSAAGLGLPEKFAPWTGFGVVRGDQVPPHRLPRADIEAGLDANGYQLWRNRQQTKQTARR